MNFMAIILSIFSFIGLTWLFGGGHCLQVLKDIKDKSIDCIITSPPYWKGFEYEAYFNSYKQYLDWCKLWLKECKRELKPHGTF